MNPQTVKPPVAEKIKKELINLGNTRIDNYFWMNERDSPKIIDYLNAENEYLDKIMKHTEPLQEKLYNEIKSRIKQDDASVPYRHNGYYYYVRYEEGKEYPLYCRKKDNLKAPEEIMLNVNTMAEGYSYYQVAGVNVSPGNNIISFGVDTLSRRQYDIYFKDLTTGEIFKDKIENTTGSTAWANDNKTIFYSIKDETLRPYKILKHKLGQPDADKEVYTETDPTFIVSVDNTKSEKYILIESSSTLSSEFRILNASNPDGEFKIFQPREEEHEYSIDHYNDKFYIRTNWNAINFRLMETPEDKTGKENWKEVIPNRNDVYLEDMEIFKNYLVLEERKNGLINLRVINQQDKKEHYIDFGEPAYTAYISVNYDFDTDNLRYGYTSLTTPNSTIDYNMNTHEKTVLKVEEVLGGFNKDNYVTERLYAKAKDGVMVPVSLVYRKDKFKKDGSNPCLLYAYGSYGISTDPAFSSARLSLLDRGFVYAIAHIRGGQEMGRQWYEDGKLLKKKNTFTDFIDCAEYLNSEKYTSKEKLFCYGGSAGGLLIGAVVNMCPDLFNGAIAGVPFVDVVTTMLDESIPLTTGEFDEWGNPKDKEYYDYMLSYSPYDNVKAQDYPAMLVYTGYHDSQVQYWEPAKWVAKLRELKTDNNPLLFKIDMAFGHSGSAGRFEKFKLVALQYAFMLDRLGMKE